LETAEKCASLLEIGEEIVLKCNPRAITDVGVGMLLAHAGVQGAFLNVIVNLGAIKDNAFKSEVDKRIEKILTISEPSMQRSMGRIEKIISRF
jgi:formiminotetrahydrofolate cyclodeaminase